MTSNQISYWKTQEERRSNRAREAETNRHNVTEEDLERANQLLKSEELRIKNVESLTKVSQLIAEYGQTTFNALPPDVKKEWYDALGLDWNEEAQSARREVASGWEVINRAWDRITKGIGNLGKGLKGLF